MSRRTPLHLFAAPADAVEEARRKLTREDCPRRYCFHWYSLGFHWEQSPEEGCYLMNPEFGSMLTRRGPWRRCRRGSHNPAHPDYYEPHQPHLLADGWRVDHFHLGLSKQSRQRRYFRRMQGSQREQARQATLDNDHPPEADHGRQWTVKAGKTRRPDTVG